jgi:hypothetical protein
MTVLSKNIYSNDPRIEKILNMLLQYNLGHFKLRETISEKGDEIDAIIIALNTLGEELSAKKLH